MCDSKTCFFREDTELDIHVEKDGISKKTTFVNYESRLFNSIEIHLLYPCCQGIYTSQR